MALFQGTINQIENTQHKINNIEKWDDDGKEKQYSDNDYPTVNAVTTYVHNEINTSKTNVEEKLNTKATELKEYIDGEVDNLQSQINTSAEGSQSNITELNNKIAGLQNNINGLTETKADKSALETAISTLNTNKVDKSNLLIGTYEVNNVDCNAGDSPLFNGGEHGTQTLFHIDLSAGTYYLSYMIKYDLRITINEGYEDNPLVNGFDTKDIFNIDVSPDGTTSPDVKIKPFSKGSKLLGKIITLSNDGFINIVLDGSIPRYHGQYIVNGPIVVECSSINIIKL